MTPAEARNNPKFYTLSPEMRVGILTRLDPDGFGQFSPEAQLRIVDQRPAASETQFSREHASEAPRIAPVLDRIFMGEIEPVKRWGEEVAGKAEKQAGEMPWPAMTMATVGGAKALRFLTGAVSPGDAAMLGTATAGKMLGKAGLKAGSSGLARLLGGLNRVEATAIGLSAVEDITRGNLGSGGLKALFSWLGMKAGDAPKQAAALAAAPTSPLAEGMARLFRGIPEGGEHAVKGPHGRSFVTTEAAAREYAGEGGQIVYVDVPEGVFSDSSLMGEFKMRQPDSSEIAPFEVFASPEAAARAQEFRPTPPKDVEAKMGEAIRDARAAAEEQAVYRGELSSEQDRLLTRVRRRFTEGEISSSEYAGEMEGILKDTKAQQAPLKDLLKYLTPDELDTAVFRISQSELSNFDNLHAQLGLRNWVEGRRPEPNQLDALEKIFPGAKAAAESGELKGWAFFKDAINVPRAIMASMDMSAILRQNIVFTASHPIMTARAIRAGVKAVPSGDAYKAFEAELKAHPDFASLKKSGLDITGLGADLLKREEQFMSSLAEKIPIIGRLVRASNRFHVGVLNKIRIDVASKITGDLRKAGYNPKDSPEMFEGAAEYVNVMTGRGPLKIDLPGGGSVDFKGAAPWLNAVLFSPRFTTARIQMLNPVFYKRLPGPVRKQAAKDMAIAVGMVSSAVSLAALHPDVEVDTDPRSADFLKARIGETRVDMGAGVTQYVRVAFLLGQSGVNAATAEPGEHIAELRGEKKKLTGELVKKTPGQILGEFLEGKEAPAMRGFHRGMTGRDPFPEGVAGFSPLALQDLAEAYKEHGILPALAVGVGAGLGVGIQQYPAQESPETQGAFQRAQRMGREARAIGDELREPDTHTLAERAIKREKDAKRNLLGKKLRKEYVRLLVAGNSRGAEAIYRAAKRRGFRFDRDKLERVAGRQ